MGTVIAPPPGQCGTNAKTSEWERAGYKKGGRGHPPRLFVRAFSRESLDPRPGPGGNHLAGANLRWSKPDHLPIRQAPGPLGPLLQHHQGHIRPVEQPETGELVPQPPGEPPSGRSPNRTGRRCRPATVPCLGPMSPSVPGRRMRPPVGVAGQGEVCPGLGVLGIVVVPVAQEDGVHLSLLGPDLVQRWATVGWSA